MDIQKILDNAVAAGRAEVMKTSPQMTLGELILKLEACVDSTKDSKNVRFDFGYMRPSEISSWRGSYSELALEYVDDSGETKLEKLISDLKEAIGKTYQGYKGGDFIMGKTTPIWVANYGNGGNTGVVGVRDLGYMVIIETAYCEY